MEIEIEKNYKRELYLHSHMKINNYAVYQRGKIFENDYKCKRIRIIYL